MPPCLSRQTRGYCQKSVFKIFQEVVNILSFSRDGQVMLNMQADKILTYERLLTVIVGNKKRSRNHYCGSQSVDKPLCFLKMGSQGRSPRQGLGAVAPHSAPARMPGVYAQRLYARTHTSGRTKSVQDAPTTNDHDCRDAEPKKHTQPFTTGKGFGVSARMPR